MLWHICWLSDVNLHSQNSISHTWRGCMLLQQQILFIDKVHILKYLIYISCSLLDQCHLLGFCLICHIFISAIALLLLHDFWICVKQQFIQGITLFHLSYIKCWAPPIIFNLHFVDIVSSFIILSCHVFVYVFSLTFSLHFVLFKKTDKRPVPINTLLIVAVITMKIM